MKEIFIHKDGKQTLMEAETVEDIAIEQRELVAQREQKIKLEKNNE